MSTKRNKICIFFTICFYVLLSSSVFSQDLETKLLRLLEQTELEQIYTTLSLIKEKFPKEPVPYYVEAFIERDADYAIRLYEGFIDRFPDSRYTPSARYKVAQYYVARNAYQRALPALDYILEIHPGDSIADDAAHLKIRTLLALNKKNEARREYDNFKRIYPKSYFKSILAFDFKDTRNISPNRSASANQNGSNYTIQVGAFSSEENATLLSQKIVSRGYPAEVATKAVDRKLFHLVWVGNFGSKDQAEAFGELFKREFEVPIQIVKK